MDQLERDQLLEIAAEVDGDTAILARHLAERFSCRGFTPEPVPEQQIEQILTLAQLSASWCNAQPWHVIVTQGAGTERFRSALYERAKASPTANDADFPFPAQYTGVYKARRQETARRLYEHVGVPFGDRAASHQQSLENFRLFGAPHVMLITTEGDLGTYGAVDCGIFMSNVILLAQSMGIATIPQAAFALFSPFIRSYFDLPENRRILAGISFGYSDSAHPANSFRTARASLGSVLTWVRD